MVKLIRPYVVGYNQPATKCKTISKQEIEDAIKTRARKYNQIIHGSAALKAQIGKFAREPHDIDVLTSKPRYHMDKMEDRLDAMAGCDAYDELVMPIVGTEGEKVYKVVKKTFGPNRDIVDYFELKKGTKIKKIKGVWYEDWKYAKKILQGIIANPQLRHRHGKAIEDLRRIEAYERSLK